jgi:hypothetical protein
MNLRLVPILSALSLFAASTVLAHSDPAPKPTFPTLTDRDEKKLLAGKLVTMQAIDGGAGEVMGIIEIDATPAEVWKILIDFEGLPESTPNIREVTRYTDTTTGDTRIIDIAYMLKVAWVKIYYSVHHHYRPAQQYLIWTLDPAKENGLKSTTGSFSTWPSSTPNKTRYLYSTAVDTGRSIPAWVEEDLTESALKKYMKHVKKTAEQ